MDNDDRQIGQILSRREILALLGATGAVWLAGCAPTPSVAPQQTSVATVATTSSATPLAAAAISAPAPACIVRPALTEGPYFVDEKLNRADIRSDPSNGTVREGTPLQLNFNVSQIAGAGCTTLEGAMVDIWHCDALGVYSDAADRSFNTQGQKFLRGYQLTDAKGTAQFTTIYPGWYPGRAVHIHFKIRVKAGSGVAQDFTSQLFFDEAITDQVHAQALYASKGQRTLKNEGDGIFKGGGNQLLLAPTKADQGYTATFDIGLNLT
ncbi:MAG: intradiol ring-cleavage dioxygenase [Chloroflexi bacterium]|nr:intradiol ring-cleavage dioxygenase [Chloroflexota bacterium]